MKVNLPFLIFLFSFIVRVFANGNLQSFNPKISILECCCGDEEEIDVPGGDFEFGPAPNPGGWIDYSSPNLMGPWTVQNGSVSHHDDGHNNLGFGNPNPSTAHVDLNGFNQGGICQTLSNFNINQEYRITFYYALHNFLSFGSASLTIDGGAALDVNWDATNTGNVIWLEAEYTFIATSSEMEICFFSETNVSCCGMLIDDIKLYTCPLDEFPPMLSAEPQDMILNCLDDVNTEIITAVDDCSDDIIVDFIEDIIINGSCEFSIVREWTAQDECGNITSHIQFLEVIDTDPPLIENPPQDEYYFCLNDIPDIPTLIAFDNCTNDPLIQFTESFSSDNPCELNLLREWTVSDDCGNFVIYNQNIQLIDEQAPIINFPPQNISVACNSNVDSVFQLWLSNNGNAVLFDDCADIISSTISDTLENNYCSQNSIEFRFSDLCGNESSATAYFNIIDTSAPLILFPPVDLNVGCSDEKESLINDWLLNNAMAIISDNCDYQVTNDFSGDFDSSNLVNFNAVDLCGNSTLYSANIVINNQVDTIEITLKTCNLNDAGIEENYITSLTGCDTLLIKNTQLLLPDSSYFQFPACDISNIINDTLYLQNIFGCDSLIFLTYFPVYGDTMYNVYYTCNPNEVMYDTIYMTNIAGCDSITYVEVNLSPADTTEIFVTTCDVNESGIDTFLFQNLYLCDSLVIINNILVQNDTTYTFSYECDIQEDSIEIITISGQECDSVIINQFLAIFPDTVYVSNKSCRIIETGQDTAYFMNVQGCDSLVYSTTFYEPIDTIFINQTTCYVEDVNRDTTNIYSTACDSVIITNTILLPGNSTLLLTRSCDLNLPNNDTTYFSNVVGCDSIVINSYYYEPILFDVDYSYENCNFEPSASIDIINVAGGLPPNQYTIDGLNFSNNFNFQNLPSGTYDIQVADAEGCISDINKILIPTYQELVIDLPDVVELSINENYLLNVAFNYVPDTFYWSNPEILSCNYCPQPLISISNNQSLTLFAIDVNGCVAEKTIQLVLTTVPELNIPNIFSPNKDGINDQFIIEWPSNINKIYEFTIVDRWGNLIFQNKNIPSEILLYWDGNYNGKSLNPGVYVYKLDLELDTGARQLIYGDITIIK